MWPYSKDEQVWLVPAKEWAERQPKPSKPVTPTPANDIDGAWPYSAPEDGAEDNRPLDPQIIIRK